MLCFQRTNNRHQRDGYVKINHRAEPNEYVSSTPFPKLLSPGWRRQDDDLTPLSCLAVLLQVGEILRVLMNLIAEYKGSAANALFNYQALDDDEDDDDDEDYDG